MEKSTSLFYCSCILKLICLFVFTENGNQNTWFNMQKFNFSVKIAQSNVVLAVHHLPAREKAESRSCTWVSNFQEFACSFFKLRNVMFYIFPKLFFSNNLNCYSVCRSVCEPSVLVRQLPWSTWVDEFFLGPVIWWENRKSRERRWRTKLNGMYFDIWRVKNI